MCSRRNPLLNFKSVGFWKEELGKQIYGISVNTIVQPEGPTLFATVGGRRVSVYRAEKNGDTKLLQTYEDPAPEEMFYTCAWSYDPLNKGVPILAAAGLRGIIRLYKVDTYSCGKHFVGHGGAINEIQFHPGDPYLLFSGSKDHTIRIWNTKTEHCVCIFGGVEGHRDQVLSIDLGFSGDQLISCGMDHAVKIWHTTTEKLKSAIRLSHKFDSTKNTKPFPTELCHFPDYSTRDIHRDYIDCCRWYGNFIISKSTDQYINVWKPGEFDNLPLQKKDKKASEIHKFEYDNVGEMWYVKFAMDPRRKILAIGNQKGKLFLWDLNVKSIEQDPVILSHPRCQSTIRQVSFSRDGNTLVCGCDDGSVWRWERNFGMTDDKRNSVCM